MDDRFDAEQEAAATLEANGPVLLIGPAGTGKTLIAMARASWILKTWPWKRKKLLFLTHSRDGEKLAEAWFEEMLPDEQLDLVEVRTHQNFFFWAWWLRSVRTKTFSFGRGCVDGKSRAWTTVSAVTSHLAIVTT